MAAIIVTAREQAILDNVASDSSIANAQGAIVDTDGDGSGDLPYCTSIIPIKDYASLVKSGSEIEQKVADGFRVNMLTLVKHLRPIAFHAENLSPNLAFTGTTELLSFDIPATERLTVTRKVLIKLDFTAFSSAVNARVDFWISVNGTLTTAHKFFFNELSSHRTVSSSWVADLPTGAVTIKVFATKTTGSGTINLDGNDFVSLSIIG
jgi:hypothetical protein